MNAKAQKGSKECVYCGKLAATVDHIPPKTIFGIHKPSDLITVPACHSCNRGASKDDEYFMQISLSMAADGHPVAKEVQAKFLRSIERKEAKKMRASFFRRVRPVEIRSPMGLYVGNTLSFRVDLDRLNGVIRRIIRGLYWKHKAMRVPDGAGVAWAPVKCHGMCDLPIDAGIESGYETMSNLSQQKVGDGKVFSYSVLENPEDSQIMTFRMDIYERIGFMGFVGRRDANFNLNVYLAMPQGKRKILKLDSSN